MEEKREKRGEVFNERKNRGEDSAKEKSKRKNREAANKEKTEQAFGVKR